MFTLTTSRSLSTALGAIDFESGVVQSPGSLCRQAAALRVIASLTAATSGRHLKGLSHLFYCPEQRIRRLFCSIQVRLLLGPAIARGYSYYRRSSMVCHCLCDCVLVTFVSPAKTDEPIEMSFGWVTRVGSRNHY